MIDTDPRTNPRLRRKLYLAGRVAKHDWRHAVVGGGYLRDAAGWLPWSELTFQGSGVSPLGWNEYVGPFFVGCDHGCGHGKRLHGCGVAENHDCGAGSDFLEPDEAQAGDDPDGLKFWDRRRLPAGMREHVSRECMLAIQRSDGVFAWLDDTECYGTLWELGFATALHKVISIYSPPGVDLSELWLPMEQAHVRSAANPLDAFAEFRRETEVTIALAGATDSPIEKLLLAALRRWFRRVDTELVCWANGDLRMWPQHEVFGGRYRLDFAIMNSHFRWKLAIECDGHDFHERTKEQAQRDKARDRDLVADGWTVLRFTGSEIHKNPSDCAEQIIGHVVALSGRESA